MDKSALKRMKKGHIYIIQTLFLLSKFYNQVQAH